MNSKRLKNNEYFTNDLQLETEDNESLSIEDFLVVQTRRQTVFIGGLNARMSRPYWGLVHEGIAPPRPTCA